MEIQAETLALLEWERLGEQVAGFAGSCLGANLCRPCSWRQRWRRPSAGKRKPLSYSPLMASPREA